MSETHLSEMEELQRGEIPGLKRGWVGGRNRFLESQHFCFLTLCSGNDHQYKMRESWGSRRHSKGRELWGNPNIMSILYF